jgi:hypothetical protein
MEGRGVSVGTGRSRGRERGAVGLLDADAVLGRKHVVQAFLRHPFLVEKLGAVPVHLYTEKERPGQFPSVTFFLRCRLPLGGPSLCFLHASG